MKRRYLYLLFCALLLSANFSGCSETETASDDVVSTTSTETVPEETEEDTSIFPDMDFGGAGFHMMIRNSRKSLWVSGEQNGEVFNDAIFDRNASLQDHFNIEITYVELSDDPAEWNAAIDNDVMSDSGAYDLVLPDYWYGCETRGNFLNLLDYTEYFHFDEPWWYAGWNDNAVICGQLYNAVGDACLDVVRSMTCVFYNKTLHESLNLEELYPLVREGKWTLDKFQEMSSTASIDLNGDGKWTVEDDQFGGNAHLWSLRGMLFSGGVLCSEVKEDGSVELLHPSEQFVDCYNKIFELVNTDPSFLYISGSDIYSPTWIGNSAFIDDRVLFLCTAFSITEAVRDATSDYGIIPMPKYDEDDDYIGYCFGTCYFAIPKTAKNPVMSAVVSEAMTAASHNGIIPAYYDTLLKSKYSRDAETAEMLDLILDSVVFEFAFVNETATMQLTNMADDGVISKQSNIMSLYMSRLESAKVNLEKFLEQYRQNAEE